MLGNICNLRKSKLNSSAQDVRRVIEMLLKRNARHFCFLPRVVNKVGACSKPRGRRKWEEGLIVKPENNHYKRIRACSIVLVLTYLVRGYT